MEGILIARVHPQNPRYSLQSFKWISVRTRHLSELVGDSHIGWATVPGVSKLFTTAPMVLPDQSSEIPVTLIAGRNTLLGSDTLLKLTLLSLHSTSSQTLLEAPSDYNTCCWCKCISEFTQSRPPSASPNSLDHSLQVHLWVQLDLGLQVHLQSRSITDSKCISELHNLGLQVLLQTRSITASKSISEFTRSSFSGAPRIALKHRLQPVQIYCL